jgi:WD40 repeat protein
VPRSPPRARAGSPAPRVGRCRRRRSDARFVDQFEETFTHCDDETEREDFVGRLVELADQPTAVVVLAVRADHLGHCAAHPELADLLTGNDVLVGPMRDTELRRAVELPARRVGLDVEAGLVEVIVADVAGRAGALPLLSTALAETWERRRERTLTLAAYRAAGGVNGALARMAEDAYQSMPAGARGAARRVLLRLCDAGDDGTIDLRRRLPMDEAAPAHDADARAAVGTLVDRRLLTVDRDSVEVAHEALLREWPRLRTWLDEDVHGRRLHRRLGDAARAWRTAGRDSSELYRGTRLDGAVDWAAAHGADLNEVEREFLDASRTEAEREVDEVKRRAAEKTRTNRRLRGLLAGVAVLLVVALAAGLLFVRQRDRAERGERVTRARELSSESALALEDDPERSILLALEAVGVSRAAGEQPLPEAVGALQRAVQTSRLVYRVDDAAFSVDASREGNLLVTTSTDYDTVIIWDAATGELVRELPAPADHVVDTVAFSPDGQAVAATASPIDVLGAEIVVWDVETGDEVTRLAGPGPCFCDTSFSPDGRLLAASNGHAVTVWELPSGRERYSLAPGPFGDVEFRPDGQTLVVLRKDERVAFHNAADGRVLREFATPGFVPEVAALDPTGELLATSSQTTRGVDIWDLRSEQLLRSIPKGDSAPLDWSPDGSRLAMAGANLGPIDVLDVDSGDVFTLRGHQAGSWDVAFLSDERLASVEIEGGLRVWDVSREGPPEVEAVRLRTGDPYSIHFSPDGAQVAAATFGSGVERIDIATGAPLGSLTGQITNAMAPIVSPDWRYIASNSEVDGRAVVRDLSTLEPVAELPACTNPKAFSRDATLIVLSGVQPCPDFFPTPPGVEPSSRVVEVGSGREVLGLDLGAGRADFNPAGPFPAGRFLAVNIDLEAVEIYDMLGPQPELLFTLTTEDVDSTFLYGPFFDPSGSFVAGGSADGTVWAFDLAAALEGASIDEALVFRDRTHNGSAQIALGAGPMLAGSVAGSPIRVWDVRSGELRAEIPTDYVGWPAMAFSPDGSYLLYPDTGGILRRYYLDTDRLIEQAESLLTRGFTADECRQYLEPARCEELGLED